MLRSEAVVGGAFLAAWLVAVVWAAGWLESPGLRLTLYGLFGFAAAFGWVMGNVAMLRERTLSEAPFGRWRRRGLYLAVPAGVVALVRAAMASDLRAEAPLAGLLALAIYAVFYFVPVSLRPRR